MGKIKDYSEIITECYRALYAASTPSANFDELVANAPIDDYGRKYIDYLAYEISEDKFDEIVDEIALKHRLKLYEKKSLQVTLCLGVSPKFSR